jgi:glucose/arabinose dehydrogenase
MRRSVFVFSIFLFACSPPLPGVSSPGAANGSGPTAPTPSSLLPSRVPTGTPAQGIATPSASPSFPPKPAFLRQVVTGQAKPTLLVSSHDGTGRLFLLEQPGTIRILKDGSLLPSLFLDLRDLVNSNGNEQGLLGLAFDPNYASSGRFFVNYTDASGGSVTARYSVSGSDPNRADPASGVPILRIAHPQYSNHNGGNLVFGPDGYLYFGMGDGGNGGDPNGNGQNLGVLLGKLLRIDVRVEPYAVPPDNPFVGRAGARPEIWAYGLRNPWRFSFDRKTGDLYIADVGQDAYEEIDFQPSGDRGGENYGWNLMEGFHPYEGGAQQGLSMPVAEYDHSGGNCSVTGGYVYRGSLLPELYGMYVFGDYCSGRIWVLAHAAEGWRMAEWLDTSLSITSFGEDDSGELYLLDRATGGVFQFAETP